MHIQVTGSIKIKFVSFLLAAELLFAAAAASPAGAQAGTEPTPLPAAFVHLTMQDGLVDSTTRDILEDDQGFMWLATQNGLNRYDGYDFTVYAHDPDDPNSLSSSNVNSVYLGQDGALWAGTRGGGLNKIDKKTGRITRFQYQADDPESISSNFINAIDGDDRGFLWLSTDAGLNRFDPQTETVVRYPASTEQATNANYLKVQSALIAPDQTVWMATSGGLAWLSPGSETLSYSDDQLGIAGLPVRQITMDDRGYFWAATEEGLFKLDANREVITHFRADPGDPTALPENNIIQLLKDSKGTIWLGTLGGGLVMFDPVHETFTTLRSNPDDPNSLLNDFIMAIYEDSAGTLWISNWTAGLNLFSPYRFKFPEPISLPTIPLAFVQEPGGVLWAGTFNRGLARIEPNGGEITYYQHDPADENSLSSDTIFTLAGDGLSGLWVGTLEGLDFFDPATESFTRYPGPPSTPGAQNNFIVRDLYLDDFGTLWIGSGNGLFNLDPLSGALTPYNRTPNGPETNYVWNIFPTGPHSLWIGAENGLFKLNYDTGSFQDYSAQSGTEDTSITTIYEDVQGIVWLGTWGSGLMRFDPLQQTTTNYLSDEGLPGSAVLGILAGDEGQLWLSTNNGLTVLDPDTEEFRTYDRGDGLLDDEFAQGAYLKNDQGEILLGVENGIVHFQPSALQQNPNAPPVRLTKFQLFNQDVPVGSGSPLSETINYTKDLVLDYDDSVISFEFAALNYVDPENNQFAYKMEGVDPEWNEVGRRRFVTYTNLGPGDYQFKVRAANNDGLWNNDGLLLNIHVNPPWWRTNFAYLFYGLAVVLVVGGFGRYRYQSQQKALARQRQELLWERRLRENLEQMDQLKDEERGRIARELHDGLAQTLAGVRFRSRTWKTMALQDPQRLLPELDDLGQILDTSIRDVRRSIQALRPLSLEELGLEVALQRFSADLQKQYQLKIGTDFQNLNALPSWLEIDLFRIAQELIFNAVRHGRPQLTVIRIHVEPEVVSLKVEDDGVGFNPRQAPAQESEGHFGLRQVRERVILLKGTMATDSRPGEGTSISIVLPLLGEKPGESA